MQNERPDPQLVSQSGGYTMKEIGDHFKIHYSLVSRIISTDKK